VYLLPDEVKRRVLRRYRRRSREVVVDERFRGWSWEFAPIDPPYDIQLPLSDIAARYCESMRDIYLRYVLRKRKPSNVRMIEGRLYHQVIVAAVEESKKLLYNLEHGNQLQIAGSLSSIRDSAINGLMDKAGAPEVKEPSAWNRGRIRENMVWLWDYEVKQIEAAIQRLTAEQPYMGLDALVNAAIPVVVEQRLDGRNIGLSGHLSADAYGAEGVVLDVKTGTKRLFHRLSTTGYAMVIESIHEYPVDVGCIVYCQFQSQLPPTVSYDVHNIDEPLRQEFLELRDKAMKLVFDQADPGLPQHCYEYCPFWSECH
jgi:CRISPR-associated protein Csa1